MLETTTLFLKELYSTQKVTPRLGPSINDPTALTDYEIICEET